MPKNADTVLNFSYLATKLPNFKLVDKKLLELEPRVSHNFWHKNSLEKKLKLKVLASPQTHCRWNVSVSKSRSVYEISQYFFHWFKAFLWSIHIASNLILATSFGFKLNNNLERTHVLFEKGRVIPVLWPCDRRRNFMFQTELIVKPLQRSGYDLPLNHAYDFF